MNLRQARYALEYLIFSAFVFVLRALPTRTAFGIADAVAWILCRVLPRKLTRYSVAAGGIRTAFGADLSDRDVDRILLGMWQHLFRMVCEIIQLPRRFRLYNCHEVLRFHQRDECVRAVMAGRPVLFLSGHFGNWEISVNTFGYFGFPMGVVARDLDNPWLHNWFRQFRESSGNWMISKVGASTQMVEEVGQERTRPYCVIRMPAPKGCLPTSSDARHPHSSPS
ncbi:MAG: hypothetical protein KDA89_16535, partial [Planctomycetaceae bacterium]|nr:hypothetical protein [Planctomycetaceae bacterium]